MKKRKKEKEKKNDEYKEKYLRALADYQNLLKRTEKEKKKTRFEVLKSVLTDFLEVLDDIEKAEIFVKDEGLILIKDKLKKIFSKWGVEEVELEGKSFNPEVAEVVDTVEGEEEGIIKKIYQKGYRLGDRMLRYAKVQVTKKIKS